MRSANFVVCNWAISHISGHTPCVYYSKQWGQSLFEVALKLHVMLMQFHEMFPINLLTVDDLGIGAKKIPMACHN